jgi:hypothetical protein
MADLPVAHSDVRLGPVKSAKAQTEHKLRATRVFRKQVSESTLRIDVVELGGLDDRVDGGGAAPGPERTLARALPKWSCGWLCG